MDNKRHLKKFENQNSYNTQKDEVMGIPHVVLLEDTKKVVYASASNDPFNGHEYVDLGLPSGTLWATSVIGGDNPLYFQWGDTEGWTAEQVENGEKKFDFEGLDYKWQDGSSMTKYNATDGKTVLDLEDDAAHVHMGGEWHMPTKEQFEELTSNTTSTWTTQNGVNGRLFTSTINGESVFVPAFSYAENGAINNVGSSGVVWSSSLHDNSYNVWVLLFDSSDLFMGADHRNYGQCTIGVVG
jgi:hypothetical protein